MTSSSSRLAATVLALASSLIAVPRVADAQASAGCAPPPPTDAFDKAVRRELGACASATRNAYGEISTIISNADLGQMRAFIARHPRDFGLASAAELANVPAPEQTSQSPIMVQRVPGAPRLTFSVVCDGLGGPDGIPAGAVSGMAGIYNVCLLPDLASAAARPRIAAAAARAIAVAEARDSGDDAPRATTAMLVARRRHPIYERRGVLVYRVAVLDAMGVRYVDVEADTGQVLDTTWTTTLPTDPQIGDGR